MKPYSSKNRVVRKNARSQSKPHFKKQKSVDGYFETKFTQQSSSIFAGYNKFILSTFNSLNTTHKLDQRDERNIKRFYKFVTGSSLSKAFQSKKNRVNFNYEGLKGLKSNFSQVASLELRLDVLIQRSGLLNLRSSFLVSKLIRSGKVTVNNRIERNHSRVLEAGDQFSLDTTFIESQPKSDFTYIKVVNSNTAKVTRLPKVDEQAKNPNQIFTNSKFTF